jgi:hypothetical protein
MISENWIIVGVMLQVLGSWSYLVDTVKGRVKPNKVSWLLWSIAPLVAFFAMIKQGVGMQAWVTFVVGFVPMVIFIASFLNKDAMWEIGKVDIICGILSILGLVLWLITKVGNVAIFFSIMADGLAAIPTIIKSYKEPDTENATIFIFGIINSLIGILTITNWNFETYGFPIYLLIVNSIIAFLIRSKIGAKFNKATI